LSSHLSLRRTFYQISQKKAHPLGHTHADELHRYWLTRICIGMERALKVSFNDITRISTLSSHLSLRRTFYHISQKKAHPLGHTHADELHRYWLTRICIGMERALKVSFNDITRISTLSSHLSLRRTFYHICQ